MKTQSSSRARAGKGASKRRTGNARNTASAVKTAVRFQRGAIVSNHHVVAVNCARSGGKIISRGEDNKIKFEVNGAPTDVYKNYADGGSLDLSSKREKVAVVVQQPTIENDPETTSSTRARIDLSINEEKISTKMEAKTNDAETRATIAKDVIRDRAKISVVSERNDFKVEIKGANEIPNVQESLLESDSTKDGTENENKFGVELSLSKEISSTKSNEKSRDAGQKRRPSSESGLTTECETGGKRAKRSEEHFKGTRATIAKTVLRNGSKMNVNSEGCEFKLVIKGGNEIPNIQENLVEGNSTKEGTEKKNKFEVEVNLNEEKSSTKNEEKTYDAVKDAQPQAQDGAVPNTSTLCAGSSNAKSSDGAKVGAGDGDCIHFSIKSLADNEIIRPFPESPFKKSDKLGTIRRLIGENQSDCKLFDNNEKPLDEEKTFEENGIKTGAVIILAKEQLAGTCTAPGHAKRAR